MITSTPGSSIQMRACCWMRVLSCRTSARARKMMSRGADALCEQIARVSLLASLRIRDGEYGRAPCTECAFCVDPATGMLVPLGVAAQLAADYLVHRFALRSANSTSFSQFGGRGFSEATGP